MKNKKIVLTFFGFSLLLVTYFFGTLLVYDPLKIYHKPWKYKEYLQWDMRQQAAGIINNWEFDSIILGTSILECTSAQEASEKLGGKFINISLAGSYFYERSIVLNYVLKKNKIKKVIYSLDSEGLIETGKSNGVFKIENWSYLYDMNPFNDVQAYINDKYLDCLFSFENKIPCMGQKLDFDRPNTWHTFSDQSIRFGGLDNWFLAKDDMQIKEAFRKILTTIKMIKKKETHIDKYLEEHIVKSEKYIDETLLQYAEQYPDTEFILVLPPYSRIKFAIDAQYYTSSFQRYKASIKYIVSKSDTLKNLKIFGWGNYAFVDNISNYKDLLHYEYKINSWMLTAIQKNEGQLTETNIDEYLEIFTEKALNYDLFILGEKIEHYLSSEVKMQ